MSLVKKSKMTEKQVAANRRNQKLCNPPETDERRERVRAALRRFGYNVQAEEMAMRALGEDPAHFQELLEALWEEWNPVGSLQEGVVIRLARALWLANRADRSQEGAALRRAQSAGQGRDNRLHARMMRLKMTAESLRSLARSVACWHYVTTGEDLDVMKKLHHEGVAGEMGEIARVAGRSFAVRVRRGNRAQPRRCLADAPNARCQHAGSPPAHQPAAED